MPMARALTALFACAWLGLAVQPCLAMEDHAAAGPATHHDSTASTGHDCPHCPPAPDDDAPCGNALSCEAIGAPSVPAKAPDLPAPEWLAVLPAADGALAGAAADAESLRPPIPPPRRTPAASFQQRFCSFLK